MLVYQIFLMIPQEKQNEYKNFLLECLFNKLKKQDEENFLDIIKQLKHK
jgi:hypothetical protein